MLATPDQLVIVDAARVCAGIAATILFAGSVGPIWHNIDHRTSTPRGRASAWALVSIAVLIGAGVPFGLGIFALGAKPSVAMATIITACWSVMFVAFAVKTADHAHRPGWVVLGFALLVPIAWLAAAMKHGAL